MVAVIGKKEYISGKKGAKIKKGEIKAGHNVR